MPGLLTTTSQRCSAASPPSPVARISAPSSAGAAGSSSTSTGSRPMDRSRRMLACPSTPSPQTPTDASASADQEIGRRIAVRNAMGAPRLQEGGGVGGRVVAQLGAQLRQETRRRRGLPAARRGPKRLGIRRCPRHTRTAWRRRRCRGGRGTAPRWPGSAKAHRRRRRLRARYAIHERGEDEVDETALVATAAPVVEPLRGVLMKGAVAAAKGAVILRQAGELLPDPQLGAWAEVGEDRETRAPTPRARGRRRPARRSSLFDHWWFTASPPVTTVGTEADHSLDSTTASRSFEDGRHQRGGADDGRDGHVPVEEPELGGAADEGVDGARRCASRAARSL